MTTNGSAIVLADGLFSDRHAKTAHALVRGPSRWPIAAVIDASCVGQDAGVLLDGRPRGIPFFPSVDAALADLDPRPTVCVIGIATAGGVLVPELRGSLASAARAGMTLVNGLHHLLADEPELVALAQAHGATLQDIRRPKPFAQLRFCTGEALALSTLRVAVLGTDCAVGKRTTSYLLRAACRERGMKAEVIHSGQTGWMQGSPYGFILDATVNDFVSGELERAILHCEQDAHPDVMILEGQAAFRNPTGPCGSEFIVSGGARGVILQHDPKRPSYIDDRTGSRPIAPLEGDLAIVRELGAEVWAVTLNERDMDDHDRATIPSALEDRLGVPVVLPLRDGLDRIVSIVAENL